ncbi:hypothetical protein [Micromonospora sp. HUAS LYJ1]|uniref:hypothetical protein n=1 Tax=Micromonospora sp. HUAS LYJ1 TaxID=3061626 RepID=UPI0026722784|nr:hypothetical protein [Micromonospora sp. HUAS LYJ1]WKU04143.1 hypothetical protein Q2K16_25505 [Micromonospora sp. HUAS LYJ1]
MTPRHLTALTAAVLLLAGCGGDPEPTAAPTPAATSRAPLPPPLLVRGTFTLEQSTFTWSEKNRICAGVGGHDDIARGTRVIITDAAGVHLAVGKLDVGQPVIDPTDATRATSCLFPFTISGVPSGKGIYGVQVSRRDKVQFDEVDLGKPISLGVT